MPLAEPTSLLLPNHSKTYLPRKMCLFFLLDTTSLLRKEKKNNNLHTPLPDQMPN